MYHFVKVKFSDMSAYVQEQALQWLQVGLSFCYKYITLRPRQDVPLCEGEVLWHECLCTGTGLTVAAGWFIILL